MSSPNGDKSLDFLGVKPIAESVKTVVDATIAGAAAFLSRICLPASEEFGLLLRDKVSSWRARNLARISARAERHMRENDITGSANPRVLMLAVEQGSWANDDKVQEMWAGLIASSCSPDGNDDSNLLFVTLLAQLSVPQVRILSYSCAHVAKFAPKSGLVATSHLIMTGFLFIGVEELTAISGISDLQRLDRELDHLRALELLDAGGFRPDRDDVRIDPTPLALHLYVRAHGYLGSPSTYFASELKPWSRRALRQTYRPANWWGRWF